MHSRVAPSSGTGRTFAVVRCPGEGVDFTVRSQRGAAVLEAYGRAAGTSRADIGLVVVLAHRLAALSRPPDPSPDDVRASLGLPLGPPLLGATRVLVDGGSLPTLELRWEQPEVSRADLDGLFGVGRLLPRTGPYADHLVAYQLQSEATASRVVVFAGFGEVPAPDSAARSVLWRVDLPPASSDPEPSA